MQFEKNYFEIARWSNEAVSKEQQSKQNTQARKK